MDRISLELTRAEVSCFLVHLPLGSILVLKLSQSQITEVPETRPVRFSNTVHCTLAEARVLLDLALKHCDADAVGEILRGIRQFSPPR